LNLSNNSFDTSAQSKIFLLIVLLKTPDKSDAPMPCACGQYLRILAAVADAAFETLALMAIDNAHQTK